MAHNLDRAEQEARKAAREELKKPHASPNSVTALRKRVTRLEKLAGIKET